MTRRFSNRNADPDDDFFPSAYTSISRAARSPRDSRQQQIQEAIRHLTEDEGLQLQAATADGKKIAKSFWGFSWVRNIESYQDYESRLPKGRSLLRAGAVIDLREQEREIHSIVADSEIYHVRILIDPPEEEQLQQIRKNCSGQIDSLMDLIQGNLSENILHYLADPENGLFPKPDAIHFSCNCLDNAVLCAHAAAALYGIGPLLDKKPDLLFSLRGIDYQSFFAGIDPESASGGDLAVPLQEQDSLNLDSLAEIFEIDLDSHDPDSEGKQ